MAADCIAITSCLFLGNIHIIIIIIYYFKIFFWFLGCCSILSLHIYMRAKDHKDFKIKKSYDLLNFYIICSGNKKFNYYSL